MVAYQWRLNMTVTGTGNMARAIAARMLEGGNSVTLLSRTPDKAKGAVDKGIRAVKAFNTTFARPLAQGHIAGQPLDVFIAGDDENAKATVAKLIEEGGQHPIDAGPLKRAPVGGSGAFEHHAAIQSGQAVDERGQERFPAILRLPGSRRSSSRATAEPQPLGGMHKLLVKYSESIDSDPKP